MKKSELLALGVPEASIREIQRIHGEEVTKAKVARYEPTKRENDRARDAITALLPMLKTPRALNAVLDTANCQYYYERRPKPTSAPVSQLQTTTEGEEQKTPQIAPSDPEGAQEVTD